MAVALLAGWLVRDLGAPTPAIWAVRAVVLVGVLATVAASLRRLRHVAERETVLRRDEHSLHTQREVLIQTVSHEFRTPLAIIQGVAETLLERDGLPERTRRALLLSVRNAVHRLADLTGVVLAVAEPLGTDNQEVVHIDDLVAELAERLARLGGPERLAVHAEDDATALVSNPHRMRLIMRAILENGLRFSPADQPVTVTTGRDGVTFHTRVRDHGEGMTEQIMATAFEPLVQGDGSTTREHGGLGIGLFAARQATVQLGGDISLVAHPDGVEVVVTLPQRRETDRSLTRRPVPRPAHADG